MQKHESQSFNANFKRFINCYASNLFCLGKIQIKLLSIFGLLQRQKVFEDYNLILRKQQKTFSFAHTQESLSFQTMIEFLICFRKFIFLFLRDVDKISFLEERKREV